MRRAQQVLVFRALMLGDMLCATPALRALRHGLPGAHVVLVGLPWAREWAERLDSVDEFAAFPGWPGLPEAPRSDARELLQFLQGLRQRRFDLALQLHGSGVIVNPLVAAFGAARIAGFAGSEAWVPPQDAERFVPWPHQGTEVERLLSLTDHLGWPRQGLALDFPLLPADHEAADRLCRRLGGAPLALVHPGARLPSRRWPPERFAAVADALAEIGLSVVLTGSADETELTQAVAAAMRASATDLAGRTTLWSLGALVERARVVLSNDTGISHIAAALGTPSVIVSSGGDATRWAPADGSRHRSFWHATPCRPCAHARCPIGHLCALGVQVDEVRRAAREAVF
jgi:ADP-heptose:LPS heptosyltransferase